MTGETEYFVSNIMMSFKIYFRIISSELFFKLIIPSVIIFLFASALSVDKIFAENKLCAIYFINSHNKMIKLQVEIADTNESRSKGLMYRKNLEKNSGMLFVFKYEIMLSFWMKNTYIPLSIAYINSDGRINDIHLMQPLDTSVIYKSNRKSMYAIEVNQGWFKNNNIVEGCRVVLNGCVSKQN